MLSNNVLENIEHRPSTAPFSSLRAGWAMLVALLLATLVVTIDNTVLNVALPSISADLDAGTSQLQWIVNGYSLLFGGLLLTGGSLADRLGRRRVLVWGLAAFAATSALVLAVGSATELIALRALLGAAAALLMPSTVALMYRGFDGRARATAIGIAGGVAGLGFVVGPLVGGALLELFPWQAVFVVNVPVAIIALLLARRAIPPDAQLSGERGDPIGTALSILAMLGLVAALIEGPEQGWSSPAVVGLALGGLIIGATFIWWELRAAHPMLDVRLIARGAVAGPGAVQGALLFAVAGVLFLVTQRLQILDGYSPIQAGLCTAPLAIGLIAGGPLLTWGSERLGAPRTAALGLLIGGAGLAGLAMGLGHGIVPLGAGLLALGAAVRVCITVAALAVLDGLPEQAAGTGAALGDTFQEIGGALGVALLGSIFNAIYRANLPADVPGAARESVQGAMSLHDAALATVAGHAFASGARIALLIGAACLAVAAVIARLTVPRDLDIAEAA
jgi:EmrB/QacA subfamily drug resistance transporter